MFPNLATFFFNLIMSVVGSVPCSEFHMSRAAVYFKLTVFLVSFLHVTTTAYKVELVQLVFRHGDRTPEKSEIYPKLSYNATLYNYIGYGQLTEVGQMREYRIGTLLQKLYGKLMGDSYLHGDLLATSTDADRTKVSLELVLTALYQEKRSEQCKHPKYLTIPMFYKPTIMDDVLMPQLCPLYIEELERVLNSTIIRDKISQYNELYKIVGENTGLDMTSQPLTSVYKVYQLVMSERSMKIATPKWITHRIFKEIEEVVVLSGEIGAYTTKLKRLSGGTLIKQFIQNMNLAEGSTEKPRMYLYSAHDINVGAFSKAHGFKKPEIPLYGSTIIVEKLRDNAGSVFVRMMLWTGVTEELITYTIPGCGKICPISKYLNFVQDIIPTDEESNCLWDVVTKDELRQYFEDD